MNTAQAVWQTRAYRCKYRADLITLRHDCPVERRESFIVKSLRQSGTTIDKASKRSEFDINASSNE
jgi:hypothetical protein